jgi:hypothetical protein
VRKVWEHFTDGKLTQPKPFRLEPRLLQPGEKVYESETTYCIMMPKHEALKRQLETGVVPKGAALREQHPDKVEGRSTSMKDLIPRIRRGPRASACSRRSYTEKNTPDQSQPRSLAFE